METNSEEVEMKTWKHQRSLVRIEDFDFDSLMMFQEKEARCECREAQKKFN